MINFNGNDLSSDIKVTEIGRSILPPSVLTTTNIIGRSGAFLFYKQFGPVTIPVGIIIKGTDLENLRTNIRSLAAKLDTDEPKRLIFSDEDDKYIKAIIADSSELNEVLAIGKGTLNFFCPDPYWYAVLDDIITGTSAKLYTFTRQGTAESYPIIEIEGTCPEGSSIVITNEMTSIKFEGVLTAGQIMYLDTDLITAYIDDAVDGRISIMEDLNNLDFPVLKTGENNLTISTTGSATVTRVKITCRSRWK